MDYENITLKKDALFILTGGAGFCDSNVCEVLSVREYKVRCRVDLSFGKQVNKAAGEWN